MGIVKTFVLLEGEVLQRCMYASKYKEYLKITNLSTLNAYQETSRILTL